MSLDYDFKIETTLPVKAVIQIAAHAIGAEVLERTERYVFRIPEVFAVAVEPNSEIGKKLMLEAYGFIPSVDMTFEYYPSKDSGNEMQAIARGTAAMLKEIEGNAVLLWNGEKTLLQRLGGKIEVTQPDYDWLARGLDEAGMKYERRQLESPLL